MIEVNNLTKFSVDKQHFIGVAKKVLKGENKEKENVSLAFVVEKEIQEINKQYRKKDKPTDVLSFEKVSDFKKEFLEVIICPAVVKEKTQDSPLSFKKELTKVFIHGLLHTLGYNHERSEKDEALMQEKEAEYFKKII